MRWSFIKRAKETEYLAITGLGIKGVKVAKSAWVRPWQRCVRFNIEPAKYTVELPVRSEEGESIPTPVTFFIGPNIHDEASLKHYTRRLLQLSKKPNHIFEIFNETVDMLKEASMTAEGMFKGVDELKIKLMEEVKLKLDHEHGLCIYDGWVNEDDNAVNYNHRRTRSASPERVQPPQIEGKPDSKTEENENASSNHNQRSRADRKRVQQSQIEGKTESNTKEDENELIRTRSADWVRVLPAQIEWQTESRRKGNYVNGLSSHFCVFIILFLLGYLFSLFL